MPQTGRRCCYMCLDRLLSSKVLEPYQGKGAMMLAGASLPVRRGRLLPVQQRGATIRSSTPAVTKGNCRFPCMVLFRSASCIASPLSSVNPKSTADEEEPNQDVVNRRRNHPGIGVGKRVVVGMSGGVDSSVAAMLLQQQGYEVVGVFMRNWDGRDEAGEEVCTADVDLKDARMVGRHLGIPVETVDFSREYWHEVFEPSMEEFARCRTPNMDVACNRFIKFDAFREHALVRLGADHVATGHYARLRPGPGGDWENPELVQALDENKDQTYFLCSVPSQALAKVLFPLGGLTKPEVRELAAKAGLPVAKKRESMGVCFVGKRKRWADFISQYIAPTPGNFVCVDSGEVVGKHQGVQLYTIGQKSHLDGMEEKYYVVGLDAETNSVIVARGSSNPTLYARGLSCLSSEFRWMAGVPPAELIPSESNLKNVHDIGTALATEISARGAREVAPLVQRIEGHRGDGEKIEGHRGNSDRSEQQRGHLWCTYRFRHRQELRPCTVELRVPIGGESSPGAFLNSEVTGQGGNLGEARDHNVTVGFPHRGNFSAEKGDFATDSSVVGDSIGEDRATVGFESEEEALSSALVVLRFDDPAKAVTPGQVVALYRDGVCLGGGPILRAEGHCSPVAIRPPSPSKL